MLTVCCSGNSERGLDTHWLPSWVNPLWCDTTNCLKAAMETQVTLLWTHSKLAFLVLVLHLSIFYYLQMPWPQTLLGRHRGSEISSSCVSHNLWIYIHSSVMLPAAWKKKDQWCVNVTCPCFAVVHRNRNQVGGSEGGHIWESRATVSHRGCSPDNLLCWGRAKEAKN